MRVLLVLPPSQSIIKDVLGVTGLPLNLAYLASHIRDHDVKIVDSLALGYTMNDLESELRSFEPDVVGITATTPTIYDAYNAAKISKQANPNCRTIIGGPHVTFMARETLRKCPYIDIVVRGEGEKTIIDILRAKDSYELSGVRGISYMDDGRIIETPNRELIENLDAMPFPAYDLLPMDKYELNGHRLGMIMSSRGCPYDCIFCSSSSLCGKKWRARSPENVVEELKYINDSYKVKEIEFLDDNFVLSNKRASRICDLIIEEGLDISWSCSSHINAITQKLAEKLKRAGCHSIYVGIESGSQAILDILGKDMKLDHARRAMDTIKKANLNSVATFMIGLPGETVDTVRSTIKFAKKLNPTFAQFTLCTPYPGTKLYEYVVKNNLLITRDWSKYTTLEPVMKIRGLAEKQLKSLMYKAYISFYLRPNVFIREIRNRRGHVLRGVLKTIMSYVKDKVTNEV